MSERHIIYGRKPFLEVFRNQRERIIRVFCAERMKLEGEVQHALDSLQTDGIQVMITDAPQLERLAEGGRHQGLVVELSAKKEVSLYELIKTKNETGARATLLALDQLHDPQNLGAVLRVAEAAGIAAVISTRRRSAPLSAIARKASAGASELIPIYIVENLQYTLRDIKAQGYWIIGTAIGPQSKSLYTTEIPEPCCIILGAEGKGLRSSTIAQCDLLIEIPMEGKVQSLNVSQATAVVLFELLRRNQKASSAG